MHISVRHDVFHNFLSAVINVQNKRQNPFLVAHFHKFFRPHPLMPFDARLTFCAK